MLSQFGSDFDRNSAEQVNGSGLKKSQNKNTEDKEDSTEKLDTSNKSSPCVWKFYQDKKNDDFHKLGYRIQLTLQKVALFFFCYTKIRKSTKT